ncbi:hypothetical protein ASG90_19935 [Nocardioides sp. Soil797]|nr:hypothetical protein ASG90_19935 [Nocardioides sp. Soil797]
MTGELKAPTKKQLADGVRLGDQTDESLSAVAVHGKTVVAVGAQNSSNLTHALFVVSADGGRTWRQGTVDGKTLPDDLGAAAADEVVWGDDGFLATGTRTNGVPVLWRSSDGKEWDLLETDDMPFTSKDSINATTWSEGTYLAVGVNSKPAGRASNRVVVWRSRDGVTWRRHDLADTLRQVSGSISVADVAVAGRRVLVVGTIDDTGAEQSDRLGLWLSKDAGRTFSLEKTRSDLGSAGRTYAQALAVHRGEFHLAVSGGGLSSFLHGQSSWDPVVVASGPNGWLGYADRAMSSVADEHPTSIFRAGNKWVITANRSSNSDGDAALYTGDDYLHMEQLTTSSMSGRGDQYFADGVAVGNRAVLVGATSRSGSTEPMVWLLDGKKVSVAHLPAGATGGEPTVGVADMVVANGEVVVVGSAADSPVAWTGTDTTSWKSQGLPGLSEQVPAAWIQDAVTMRKGRVLAVGTQSWGNGRDGVVWTRGRNGSWRKATPPALNLRTERGYGTAEPAAVATHGNDLVIAANRYIEGRAEIRPFYSHDGGKSWHVGSGTNEVSLSESEDSYGITRWADFAAPLNGDLAVNDVARVEQNWVMGGFRSNPRKGDRPVVWRSDTGVTWSAPTQLPMPDDAHGAGVTMLTVHGEQVLATGWVVRHESDAEPSWVSWTSDDGGRTWQIGVQVATSKASVNQVLELEDGYLALGDVGASAAADTRAWVSADGLHWDEVDLGLVHADGPGAQSIALGVISKGQLHVVTGDIRPTSGSVRTQTVAIPDIRQE